MKQNVTVGIVGLGARGQTLLDAVLLPMTKNGMTIAAVCDTYEDRMNDGTAKVEAFGCPRPFATTDYHAILARPDIDAILIISSWESHIPIAIDAMKAGKYVGLEVGGAYSVQQCWDLVHTYEQTGTPLMLLENCCYSRRAMMLKNMVAQGVFGEIVHCAGGYCHDLREEIAYGAQNRHYRLRNYMTRNADNYPTHDLGPAAQILGINRGNRMLSLTSTACSAKGVLAYAQKETEKGAHFSFDHIRQGDIVNTVIRCAGGQTIALQLDTTLPRAYSRKLTVRGTKGGYEEDNDSLFIDGIHNRYDLDWRSQWGNAEQYADAYEHPIWRSYRENPIGGHDGIDWLVFNDFIDHVRAGTTPPIDVYDAAAWMCLTPLSEQSIAAGSEPMAIPDFTNGAWSCRT